MDDLERKAATAAARKARRERVRAADPEAWRKARSLENKQARIRRNATETPEQREKRLAKAREAEKVRRANRTDQQHEEHRAKVRERMKTDSGRSLRRERNRRYRQRVNERSPEEVAKYKAKQAAYARKYYWRMTPDQRARFLAANAKRKKEYSRQRANSSGTSKQFAGSVLAASAPSPWRDVLAQITAMVPRIDDRDDVIAEAVLLVLEGADAEQAVKAARKTVGKAMGERWKSVPVHDCHWL